MKFIGSVTRKSIEQMIARRYVSVEESMDEPVRWMYLYKSQRKSIGKLRRFYGNEVDDIKPGESFDNVDLMDIPLTYTRYRNIRLSLYNYLVLIYKH